MIINRFNIIIRVLKVSPRISIHRTEFLLTGTTVYYLLVISAATATTYISNNKQFHVALTTQMNQAVI